MTKHRFFFAGIIIMSGVALAQSTAQAPPPPSTANQLTPQVLGQMLQSAATFHDLVEKMNLSKSLGPDQHIQGSDGQFHHPVERTAQVVGAGAGAGAAIGAMTRNQNGVLIGALIGGASGLIIDEILKHREEVAAQANRDRVDPNYVPRDYPHEFKQRDQDRDRQTY